MKYKKMALKVLEGQTLSKEEALELLKSPDDDILELMAGAFVIRKEYFGKKVYIQLLKNAKSGHCSEDCHYCSQSSISEAPIDKYSLEGEDSLAEGARRAEEIGAKRYCMALSGRILSDREVDRLCASFKKIKTGGGPEICCSLGFLTPGQAEKLKAAGLDRVNHNLNTSRNYYGSICTTHTYDQRIENIKICKEAGLEICSGGILGQGESDADVIDFFFELKEVNPQSIPLNFLIPVKGTPFGRLPNSLSPVKCLKMLALARYLLPQKEIRLAGGREYHLKSYQPLALYAVNSLFVRGYLTTGGDSEDSAIRMIKEGGFHFEVESSG